MRRGWILLLLVAAAGAQDFSESELDRAIREVARGEKEWVERIAKWGPQAKRAAPALVAAWKHSGSDFRAAVSAALLAIGPHAVPEVAKAAKGKDLWLKGSAEKWLASYVSAPLSPALGPDDEGRFLPMLNEPDRLVREAAARALATRGSAIALKLAPLLTDKSPKRRHGAAFALGRIDPPPEEVLGALVAATGDTDESVRAAAVFAVGRLRSEPQKTTALLFRATEDPSPRVVQAALAAFEARGKEAVPLLIEAWDRSDAAASAATEALVRFGDAILEQVVEAVKAGGPRRKRFGAVYLGRIGSQFDLSVIERTLVPILAEPEADVRLAAAEAFGIALPEIAGRALDALLAATADTDPRVRANALAAAARGGPADARVRTAIEKAALDPAAAVNLTATLLKADAGAAATWGAAVENAALPVPARVLAVEKLRALPAGFAPILPGLTKVLEDAKQPTDLRASAAYTLRLLLARRIFEGRYAGKGDPATRAAVDKALRWLAGAQGKDGRWSADGWNDYDLGVTSLALLAFLAAGHTHREFGGDEPYVANVREGIKFLVSCHKDGLFKWGETKQHVMVEHAIATQAMVEAVAMTGDRSRRVFAEHAVIACEMSRNPSLAWSYVPHGGENDTHVTAWMAGTLRVADAAGYTVDADAFEGARQWIDKMTEPNFGQVGYNYPGGQAFRAKGKNEEFPPELTYSTTAAGIWLRMILGEDPKTSEMVRKGGDLCVELRPTFARREGVDFYYWYYGTLACFEIGGMHWTKWESELKKAVLAKQKPDGSWDPEDAWGFSGGRVYATSILTLALLTPSRYPRGWGSGTLPAPYAQAAAALKAAAETGAPRVRAAAQGERPK